jgi:hypothetical protein
MPEHIIAHWCDQRPHLSAEAVTEDLNIVDDTAIEDTGETEDPHSELDDTPQGSVDDRVGLTRTWVSLLSGFPGVRWIVR